MTSYSSKAKENARVGYWRRQFKKSYRALVERYEGNCFALHKSRENELNYAIRVDDLTSKLASSQGDLLRTSMHFLTMMNQTHRSTTRTIDHLITSIEEAYKETRTLRKTIREKDDLLKKVKEKAKEMANGLYMTKSILSVRDRELAEVNVKVYQKELELVKANSKASDMEKELEMTRQTRGKEQETEKTGKSSEEPSKEITIFKVSRGTLLKKKCRSRNLDIKQTTNPEGSLATLSYQQNSQTQVKNGNTMKT